MKCNFILPKESKALLLTLRVRDGKGTAGGLPLGRRYPWTARPAVRQGTPVILGFFTIGSLRGLWGRCFCILKSVGVGQCFCLCFPFLLLFVLVIRIDLFLLLFCVGVRIGFGSRLRV